ncbi:hypothetical protein BDV59DRAFT_205017 [Aspergillus ambiguus]|uniref:uncharacterized protein n=1 Tax=Aspergillus ambiguus TaxID=176160 RepID=UPI003CCDFB65
MVQFAQLLAVAVLGASSALATTGRIFVYSDTDYRGAYVEVPSNGHCYDLSELQPFDLTGQVESIVISPGNECALFRHSGCGLPVYKAHDSISDLVGEGVGPDVASISCVNGDNVEDAQREAEDAADERW